MTEEQFDRNQFERKVKSESRIMAMKASLLINEPLVNMGMSSKQKIIDDAQEFYDKLTEGLIE